MFFLCLGVALFLGIHSVPSIPVVRERLIRHAGVQRYRGLFALVALAGLVLIVVGKSAAPMVALWSPPLWGFKASILVMPLAFVLQVAAYFPTNLKRFTRHPMLWSVAVWASLHLLTNGDLASLILFGSFGAFAFFDMWSANRRGARHADERLPWWREAVVVVVGLLLYTVFLYFHESLFGRPVLSYWSL